MSAPSPLTASLRALVEKWQGQKRGAMQMSLWTEAHICGRCADELESAVQTLDAQLADLLGQAFEAGHWAWPTPDHPTRASLREAAVRALLTGAPAEKAACSCEIDRHDFNCPVHGEPTK